MSDCMVHVDGFGEIEEEPAPQATQDERVQTLSL